MRAENDHFTRTGIPVKKRVLLVGDVGTRPDGYYHVGDEAGVYQNLSLYRQAGEFSVSLCSWAITHQHLEVREYPFWAMPTGPEGCQRIEELLKQAERLARLPFLRYPENIRSYTGLIREHDLIHISGGGNLNSLYPAELYSRALIMLLAKTLGKPLLLTGQTIGPITGPPDRDVARRALNAADVITVRDGRFSPTVLRQLGVDRPRLHVGLDDAYFMDSARSDGLEAFWVRGQTKGGRVRVGVSVHPDAGDGSLQAVMGRALQELGARIPIEVYFIPHIVVNEDTRLDVSFMRGISERLPADIPQRLITFQDLMRNPEPAKERLIKGLTAAMDLQIATRYHALVFALADGVSVLALNSGQYITEKNVGLLELAFEEQAADYSLDVPGLTAEALLQKLERLITRRAVDREALLEKRRAWSARADFNLRLARELLQMTPQDESKSACP